MKKLFVLCLCVLLFAAPDFADDKKSPEQILILVPESTSSLPFFLLEEKQPLAGIRIRVETFAQHAQALVRLIRGEADFLITGTTQGWQSFWDGNPLVAINSYVWGVSSLLVRADGPKTLAGLKGKSVSLPFPNSPLDVKTRFLLERAGLSGQKDVRIEYRAFAQAVPLLLSGAIDAAAFPEPIASNLVMTQKLVRLLDYRRAWGEALQNDGLSPEVTLFTTAKRAAELDAVIPILHGEISRMIDTIPAHKNDLASRYSHRFGFPEPVILEALGRTSFWSCDFSQHAVKIREYLGQIKPYFSTSTGELPDHFFYPNKK